MVCVKKLSSCKNYCFSFLKVKTHYSQFQVVQLQQLMDLSNSTPRTTPVVILVVGMAGSGKTTLMHRINIALQERGSRGYYINLDPAVGKVPFSANIDIRDTVNYKEVMSQYNLGPVCGTLCHGLCHNTFFYRTEEF